MGPRSLSPRAGPAASPEHPPPFPNWAAGPRPERIRLSSPEDRGPEDKETRFGGQSGRKLSRPSLPVRAGQSRSEPARPGSVTSEPLPQVISGPRFPSTDEPVVSGAEGTEPGHGPLRVHWRWLSRPEDTPCHWAPEPLPGPASVCPLGTQTREEAPAGAISMSFWPPTRVCPWRRMDVPLGSHSLPGPALWPEDALLCGPAWLIGGGKRRKSP